MPMLAIALAGLGATVGTAMHNKKVQAQQLKMQQEAQKKQEDMLAQLAPYGHQNLQEGQQNMTILGNHLRSVTGGNRQGLMSAMQPEINRLTQGMQGSVEAQRALYPRGGQSASQAANLPFFQQGQINNMLAGARQDAFGQLGQLGANQASLGLGAFGQGQGLTNSMLNYGLNARNQSMMEGNALGQGLGGFGNLLLQYYQNRPDSTAGAKSSPYMPVGSMNNSQSNGFNFMGQPTKSTFDQYSSAGPYSYPGTGKP